MHPHCEGSLGITEYVYTMRYSDDDDVHIQFLASFSHIQLYLFIASSGMCVCVPHCVTLHLYRLNVRHRVKSLMVCHV